MPVVTAVEPVPNYKVDLGSAWPADRVARRSIASLIPYARNGRGSKPGYTRSRAGAARASTLTGTDPLLLIRIDPSSAHGFGVSWADQPIPDRPSGNYSFVRLQEPFLRPDLGSARHGLSRRSMMAARPPRTCAAHSVIEGRLRPCQAWIGWGSEPCWATEHAREGMVGGL
jgi:hypothetical protein